MNLSLIFWKLLELFFNPPHQQPVLKHNISFPLLGDLLKFVIYIFFFSFFFFNSKIQFIFILRMGHFPIQTKYFYFCGMAEDVACNVFTTPFDYLTWNRSRQTKTVRVQLFTCAHTYTHAQTRARAHTRSHTHSGREGEREGGGESMPFRSWCISVIRLYSKYIIIYYYYY